MVSNQGKDIVKKIVQDCKVMTKDNRGFVVKELEELASSLQKDMKEEIFQDIKNNGIYRALYNSANEFYNNIIKLNQTSIKSLNAFSGDIGNITTGYKARTIRLRLAYLSAFKFAEYVHQYLGQPLSKALVVLDGEQGEPYTVELSLIELVRSAGSAGHFHQEWIQDIINSSQQDSQKRLSIEASLQNQEEHLSKLRRAYSYVQENMRFVEQKKTKKKDGKTIETKGGQYYIKLYNENNEWRTYNIINKGDLKEAYAAALMRQHQSKIKNLQKPDSICLTKNNNDINLASAFFHSYISQVDNKKALLGEDVELEDIQYAVKAANAQLPSLAQYIRAAQAILALKEDNLQQGITDYFNKEKQEPVSFRNKLVEKMIKDVEDALDSTI